MRRWITQPGSDLELCVRGLSWLAQVCTDRPDLLTQGAFHYFYYNFGFVYEFENRSV